MTPGGEWFDSHCHLQDAFRHDSLSEADAIAAAVDAGVGGLVCVGTDAASSTQALDLVTRGRTVAAAGTGGLGLWATVGLHPHEASQGLDEVVGVLDRALADGSGAVVAVGECGLDYHYDHSSRLAQRAVFAEQIELAAARDLALVVHTRSAWDDTVDILRAGSAQRVVIHCFTGGPDEARRCLDLGAYLSFSGIVTFANAQDVRDAAALCPLDRLLIETDAPFLAPVPHRGRTNQPAYVSLVGEAVATVRGVPADVVASSSNAAAVEIFALS
ncbi:MAG TPA: TatD family hydrolase [Acidimicrobiales bacterium]|nr:TatD family hydrolase [Acidimicrobiales bacterium]